MKDLYRKLGIDPKASHEEVAAALESQPDMHHCSPILKDQEKRAAYNQAHATLNAIGILRHRLGLDSEDSWFLENCPHFAPRLIMQKKSATAHKPVLQGPAPGYTSGGSEPAETKPVPSNRTGQSILIVAVVVTVMLAILAYTLL